MPDGARNRGPAGGQDDGGGERSGLRVDLLCIALLLVAGTSLCLSMVSGRWGTQPRVEDEFVYLFQARTLAAGRLSYPSPPLPEFFEAAHLLVVPSFAARYLPGHALVLAPFVAAGRGFLAPCLLLGLTAALLFAAARLAGLSRGASAGAAALLLGAADVVPVFAGYRSQSTSLAAVAALIVAALAALRRPSGGRIAALAACAGFAVLVRPFAGAAALLVCAVVLLRLRREAGLRKLAWALPPLAIALLLAGISCKAATGSWTTAPWSLYARQYMPFDGPGIGAVRDAPPERPLPAHLQGLRASFLASRQRHTWARLPGEALRRLRIVARLAPGWLVIPFAAAGLFWTPLWSAWLFALAFFLLELLFHAGDEIYFLEIYPCLALAAAAGAELAVRGAMRLRRPLQQGALAVLGAAALYLAVEIATELRMVLRVAADRGWTYARWEPAFAWFRERRALVFVRYPPRWDSNVDLTYNEPDLARAEVVFAIDHGERNQELLPYFPGRPAFLFDPVSSRIERLR